MVHPFCALELGTASSIVFGGGYEPGLGGFTWVYENARVEDDDVELDLGTCLGGVEEEPLAERFQEFAMEVWRGSSESDPLSQASSQSVFEVVVKLEWTAMCGLAGGEIGFIATTPCTLSCPPSPLIIPSVGISFNTLHGWDTSKSISLQRLCPV